MADNVTEPDASTVEGRRLIAALGLLTHAIQPLPQAVIENTKAALALRGSNAPEPPSKRRWPAEWDNPPKPGEKKTEKPADDAKKPAKKDTIESIARELLKAIQRTAKGLDTRGPGLAGLFGMKGATMLSKKVSRAARRMRNGTRAAVRRFQTDVRKKGPAAALAKAMKPKPKPKGKGRYGSKGDSPADRVAALFMKLIGPLGVMVGLIGSAGSGFGVFTKSMQLFAAILAPVLLPVFVLLAATVIALSDDMTRLLPLFKQWFEIVFKLVPVFESLLKFASALADQFGEFGKQLKDLLVGMGLKGGDKNFGIENNIRNQMGMPLRGAGNQEAQGAGNGPIAPGGALAQFKPKDPFEPFQKADAKDPAEMQNRARVARAEVVRVENLANAGNEWGKQNVKGFQEREEKMYKNIEGDLFRVRHTLLTLEGKALEWAVKGVDEANPVKFKEGLPPVAAKPIDELKRQMGVADKPDQPGIAPPAQPNEPDRPGFADKMFKALQVVMESLQKSIGPKATIGSLDSVGNSKILEALNTDPIEAKQQAWFNDIMGALGQVVEGLRPRPLGQFKPPGQ